METTREPNGQLKQQVRACDACRALKTRCAPSPNSYDSACHRCTRLKLTCKSTPRARKKQRKRTDARVTVLEKELENLRSSLSSQNRPSQPSSPQQDWPRSETSRPTEHNRSEEDEESISTQPWKAYIPDISQPFQEGADFIERGLVSYNEVLHLVKTYINDCCHLYPVVQLDPSVPISALRESRPIVFQAVVAAAATKQTPRLAVVLQSEMINIYAKSILSDESNQLDLIQAVLISVSWYLPPRDFSHKRKFYELAHMAISTALEIGLDSVSNSETTEESTASYSPTLERARTFVSCYMLSQGMSMTLRRPSMLRTSTGLLSCISKIQLCPTMTPLDKILLECAKLFQIVESISEDLAYSDPTRNLLISQRDIIQKVRKFRQELLKWRDNAGLLSRHDMLNATYHYTMVYLHEVALYHEHEPSDFVAPFQLNKVGSTKHSPSIPESDVSTCIAHLIDSAQSFVDVFLSLDDDTLRVLPVSHYFRLVYIAFVLTKVSMSEYNPHSRIGKIVNASHIKRGYYRSSVLKRLHDAAEQGLYPGPKMFLEQLGNLGKHWKAYTERMSMSFAHTPPSGSGGSDPGQTSASADEIMFDATTVDSGVPMQIGQAAEKFRSHQTIQEHTEWSTDQLGSSFSFFPTVPVMDPGLDAWTPEDLRSWEQMLTSQTTGSYA